MWIYLKPRIVFKHIHIYIYIYIRIYLYEHINYIIIQSKFQQRILRTCVKQQGLLNAQFRYNVNSKLCIR